MSELKYFKIVTLDGDLVNASESSQEDAELELSYYDENHYLVELTAEDYYVELDELENDWK